MGFKGDRPQENDDDFFGDLFAEEPDYSDKFNDKLDALETQASKPFDKEQHAYTSRLEITKLFLHWYFGLIAGSFIFCIVYNGAAAWLNASYGLKETIKYVDLANTVSLITTALGSGVGFVIGYYFKNKAD